MRWYRYGGQESTALLPDTDLDSAVMVAHAVRAAIEAVGIDHEDAPTGRLAVTVGARMSNPAEPDTPRPMYYGVGRAQPWKYAGRNTVEVSAPLDHLPVSSHRHR